MPCLKLDAFVISANTIGINMEFNLLHNCKGITGNLFGKNRDFKLNVISYRLKQMGIPFLCTNLTIEIQKFVLTYYHYSIKGTKGIY